MSTPLILLVTVCYMGVALNEALKQNWGMCIVFLGYSFANVGIIMMAMK